MARKQLVPQDMNSNKITNLGAPSNPADAATKQYVDDNSGGSLSVRRETLDNQTISFTDDVVYIEGGVNTIYLPHDTTGHAGKRITIGSLSGFTDIVEVINPSPLSTATVTLYKVMDLVVLEAKPYGALTTNWQVVERVENVSDRIVDSETNASVLYVPYVGAYTDLDFSGVSVKTVSVSGPDDSGISISAGAVVTPDTSGSDASLGGGLASGNGNGGRAVVVGGNADTSGGFDGNGGNVYLQTGQGAGSGTPGVIELRQGGKGEYATLSIDSLTANQTYNLPNMSGSLLAGDGTNGITVGTTAPSSPATGDLWVDTN